MGEQKLRVIFHADLDAFFASVEVLDKPELAGKPVIVGGMPGSRGVVSTCSYEARKFGVHSAMPSTEAKRRCPHAIFLPPRFERYLEISATIMEIFGRFSPLVQRVSIDEAFLDMTGTERLWGAPRQAGTKLKEAVQNETGLTISLGIAPNHYVAKIASGLSKPDGLTLVEPGQTEKFVQSLPLEKLWGVGKKTREKLEGLGLGSISKISGVGQAKLEAMFGKASGSFLYRAARGEDVGRFEVEPAERSISSETTFEKDIADFQYLESVILSLAQDLCHRLWNSQQESCTIGIKIRYHDFSTKSRTKTRNRPYRESSEVYHDAMALLDATWDKQSEIRLIGVSLSKLRSAEAISQPDFFAEAEAKKGRAESSVFAIEKKGLGKLTKARLLKKNEIK